MPIFALAGLGADTMSPSQAHDFIVSQFAKECASGVGPEFAAMAVLGAVMEQYGGGDPPPDVIAIMDSAIKEGMASCGGPSIKDLPKGPLLSMSSGSVGPGGMPIGNGGTYSNSARGPMPTSRPSSLTSYRQVAPTSGYRLPSKLSLAARRPTGMTSLRLPEARKFPAHCYTIPPGSSVPPDCQDQVTYTPLDTPTPGVVEASGKTALYLGLGVAAVVVGVVVYSSRSSMTANGRRRRSRRRHRRH